MHHHEATTTKGPRRGAVKSGSNHHNKTESRYTVALPAALAHQVEQYAATVDTSMSRAIAALVRLDLQTMRHWPVSEHVSDGWTTGAGQTVVGCIESTIDKDIGK